CRKRKVRLVRVSIPDLSEARMQNIAVLATMDKNGLVQGIETEHYRLAMEDLMAGGMLEKNLGLFDQVRG
ncbi:MAG: hypothetical protein P8X55_05450, partial [Desulfosarcinaceae bacterium]